MGRLSARLPKPKPKPRPTKPKQDAAQDQQDIVSDAGFPDLTLEERTTRSKHFTHTSAAYDAWGISPTAALTPDLKHFAWKVPGDVMELIPEQVREILTCTGDSPLVVLRNLDLVDICAGKARITRWALWANLQAVAIDRSYSPHLDINSNTGYAIALTAVLRTKPRTGLIFMGPQCSSWVWISRGTTQRSCENPDGHDGVQSVMEGNELNLRVGLMCMIATKLGIPWIIEQPSSSLFFETDTFKSVILATNAQRVHINLGDYGHLTRKPTLLLGTVPWLQTLARPPGTHAARRSKSVALVMVKVEGGKRRVTGKRKFLKASQVYPVRFAGAIVKKHWLA